LPIAILVESSQPLGRALELPAVESFVVVSVERGNRTSSLSVAFA